MLLTAKDHSRGQNIVYARADAADFDPQGLFGIESFDRIFISYALSMIPSWQAVLASAAGMLAADGELHVRDFGQQERLPQAFRAVLRAWLAKFHVTPRVHLRMAAEHMAQQQGASITFVPIKGGYAGRLTLKKQAGRVPAAA